MWNGTRINLDWTKATSRLLHKTKPKKKARQKQDQFFSTLAVSLLKVRLQVHEGRYGSTETDSPLRGPQSFCGSPVHLGLYEPAETDYTDSDITLASSSAPPFLLSLLHQCPAAPGQIVYQTSTLHSFLYTLWENWNSNRGQTGILVKKPGLQSLYSTKLGKKNVQSSPKSKSFWTLFAVGRSAVGQSCRVLSKVTRLLPLLESLP